jgi:hypothetical protein
MAGTSNQNVIITLTGDSTGIQKAAKSGAIALQSLNAGIQANIQSTHLSASSISTLRVGYSGFVGTVAQAKLVAAQLHAEQQRGIRINELLTQSLSKQEVALLRSKGLMQGMAGSAGSAQFAVLGLTQGVQDMGNFGMGAAQGIRAVNNNIQQFATALTFAAAQAGGLKLALKGMWTALKGPAGILLAFSLVSAAVEWYSNATQRAKKETEELTKAYKDLLVVVPAANAPLKKMALASDIEDEIAALKTKLELESASLALLRSAPPEIITGFGAQMRSLDPVVRAAEKSVVALRQGIEDLTEQLPTSTKEAEGFLSFITTVQEENAKASQTVVDLRGKIKDLSLELADAGKHGELEKRLKDLQDLKASGWNAGMGGSSTSAIEALNADYEEFTKTLASFNSNLSVSRSEYAKLVAAHEVESTLAEEWAKGAGRFATNFTEGIESAKDTVGQLEENLRRLQGPEGERLVALELQAEALEKQIQLTKDLLEFELSGLPDGAPEKVSVLGPEQIDRTKNKVIKSAGEIAGVVQRLQVSSNLSGIVSDYGERVETDADRAVQALNKLNNAFENVAAQGITSMIDGLASLATGQEKNLAVALILPFADMAIQLGKIAILAGLGIEKIKSAFKNLHGPTAIAAGVALVTLGSVVKSQIKKTGSSIGASSGGSGGSSFSPPNTFSNFTSLAQITAQGAGPSFAGGGGSSASNNMQFRFVMRGDELIGVMDNTIAKGDAIVGRGTIGTSNRSSFVYSDVLDGIYRDGKGV